MEGDDDSWESTEEAAEIGGPCRGCCMCPGQVPQLIGLAKRVCSCAFPDSPWEEWASPCEPPMAHKYRHRHEGTEERPASSLQDGPVFGALGAWHPL